MNTIIATPKKIEKQHSGATAEPAAAQVCPAMWPSGAFAVERKRCTTIHPYRLETCQMSPVVLQPLQQIPAKVAAVEIDQDL